MTGITRRAALVSATAAVAVVAIPAGVQASEPLLALVREWFAYRDYVNNHPDESDEGGAPRYVRLDEMVERIYLTPAQTIQGAMAKLRVWSADCGAFQGEFFTDAWWRGDTASMHGSDRGFAGVMRDLERLARESRS